MEKCRDCVVGLEDSPYECSYIIFESNYFETDDKYCYKFNYCPLCGHKIDYKVI